MKLRSLARAAALLALTGVLLWAPPAVGCPCSDDAGSGLSLTHDDERVAAALVMTTRQTLGAFDAQGRYRAQSAHEHEASQELLLRAAVRWPSRLEWLGELGYAAYRLRAGGVSEEQRGVGDALVRARYQVWDESMPHEPLPLPALGAALLLRMPLGLAASTSSGFGSGGAQLGLGAWELGAGIDASRSLSAALRWLVASELAYRFEDHTLGRARRLGPRWDSLVGLRLEVGELSSMLGVRARLTGDATFGGRVLPGTGERLLSVVLGGGLDHRQSGVRSAITLSLDPPLGGASASASVALGAAVGVGWR